MKVRIVKEVIACDVSPVAMFVVIVVGRIFSNFKEQTNKQTHKDMDLAIHMVTC